LAGGGGQAKPGHQENKVIDRDSRGGQAPLAGKPPITCIAVANLEAVRSPGKPGDAEKRK